MATTIKWASRTLLHGVHAFVAGEGVPIVLLPGWPQTAEAYAEVVPYLSQRYQVWAIDPPGLGDSAPAISGYDTKSISRILQEVMKSVITEPIHLVGHDVGAWIAFAWAAQFPESLRSLTMLDSAIPGLAPPLSFPLPDQVNVKLWQFAFNRLPELPEILTQGRERPLLNWLFDQKAEHPDRISQAKRDRYIDCYSKPGNMSNGFEYYRSVTTSSTQNVAFAESKLRMPVLALGGQTGVGNGLKMSMEKLADNVQGGEIESCGHYVMEEQPEIVARKLLDFLKTVK
jgi:pimeloyl-ACP methyl ester carboxylesterase